MYSARFGPDPEERDGEEGSCDDEARCDLGTGTLPRHLAWTNQSHANRMFYLACGTSKRDLREKSLFDDHASNGSTVSGHNRIDVEHLLSTCESNVATTGTSCRLSISVLHDHNTGTFLPPRVRSRSITIASQSPHFLYPTSALFYRDSDRHTTNTIRNKRAPICLTLTF
jgi:hypothetical protein